MIIATLIVGILVILVNIGAAVDTYRSFQTEYSGDDRNCITGVTQHCNIRKSNKE